MPFPSWSRRRWIAVGAVVAAIGGLGALLLGGLGRDPWPVRVVISPPQGSRPQGFTADGRSYLTSNGNGLSSWDAATGQARKAPANLAVYRKSYASDGRSFVGMTGADFAASEVVWVDEASGAIKARFPVQARQVLQPTLEDGGRSIRAFLGDKNFLLEIATWDLATGAEARRSIAGPGGRGLPRNMPPVGSPDGRIWLYFDATGGGVRLWDVAADRPVGGLLRPHSDRLVMMPAAVFTPDDRTLILGQADGQAEFWDVATSRQLKVIRVHRDGCFFENMAIAPDGRTLASFGKDPRLWSSLLLVRAVCAHVFFGSSRGVVYETVLTDLATGRTLARSPGSIQPEFSPDGRTIATGEPDGTFAIRDAPRPSGR